MRLLLVPPYFYPEQMSSSHLDNDRMEAYGKAGISVEVIAPNPTRGVTSEIRKHTPKEEFLYDGVVHVRRFPLFREGKNPLLRALRYVFQITIQYIKARKLKDIDVLYSGSTPPIQGILCGPLKKKLQKNSGKYVPYVYCLQDVFPDSLVNAGMTHKGSLIWRIGRRIENYTYNHADKIIVISQGFKRNIVEKGVPEEKIEVISNWIDLDSVHPVERKDNTLISEFGLDANKFIVVYAGNFGAAQGADIVLKAAKELEGNKDIQFVIFGGGPYFEDARKEAEGLKNVFIHDLMPQDRISEVYSLGDVALITCKAGTGKAGMPSKTWSIMACNTPIIASFDTNSDLADVIRDSGAGCCVEPENLEALSIAILRTYSHKNSKQELRSYVKKHASKDCCVKRYIDVIENNLSKEHK